MAIKQGIESGKLDPSLIMWQIWRLTDEIENTNTKLNNSVKQQDEREKRWAERFDSHQKTETKLCHIIESQSENIAMMHESIKSLNDEMKQITKDIFIVKRNTKDIEQMQTDYKGLSLRLNEIDTVQKNLKNTITYIVSIFTLILGSIISIIIKKVLM
jgi:predicted RNase H-like nuclease (RuvC/YqgF family)